MLNAVLVELTALQDLTLCHVQDTHVLPMIGRLQRLTQLSVHSLSQDQQVGGLRYLSSLYRLRELQGFVLCSESTMKQFWADLHA